MRYAVLFILPLLAGAGCNRSEPAGNAPTENRQEQPSQATVIDHMTGRAAVQQGRQAADKLRAIELEKRRQMEGVEDL